MSKKFVEDWDIQTTRAALSVLVMIEQIEKESERFDAAVDVAATLMVLAAKTLSYISLRIMRQEEEDAALFIEQHVQNYKKIFISVYQDGVKCQDKIRLERELKEILKNDS